MQHMCDSTIWDGKECSISDQGIKFDERGYAVDCNPCPSCELGEYCEKEEHCNIQPTNHGQNNPGGPPGSNSSDGTEGSNSTYRDGNEEEDLTQSPTEDKDEVENEILF